LADLINVNKASGVDISPLLKYLDHALSYVNTERAYLGAVQNRIEFTASSLLISSENLQAAESRIRDADMAREMMVFTKTTVLQQSATAMLAQANLLPQSVLLLLR
jgi:flagellin